MLSSSQVSTSSAPFSPVAHTHLPRCRSIRCNANQLPSDGSMKQPTQAELLKRMKKAKEYAQEGGSKKPLVEQDKALESFDKYAIKQAQDEQAAFLQAQNELAAAKPPPSTEQPAAKQSIPPGLMERLNKAKAYKTEQSTPSSNAPTTHPPPSPPASTTNTSSSSQRVEEDDRAFRRGGGTADQAANWLQTIATQGLAEGLDTSMREEAFTLMKEERQKDLGVEIQIAKGAITSNSYKGRREVDMDYGLAQQQVEAELQMATDTAYAGNLLPSTTTQEEELLLQQQQAEEQGLEGDEQDESHKPAVATWGVFPRPKNISEAYGGGRNLRPGQALETEEVAKAREARIAAALTAYKKTLGLDIDPAVEAEAQSLYEKGEVLFKDGNLPAALKEFTASAELVPLKSRIGGLASLQMAICLDSLGRNDDAFQIYKKLKSHSAPGVSKTSRRMLYGFEAAQDLKVKIDSGYDVKSWSGYFDRIQSNTWAMYKAPSEESEEEDQEAARNATLLAAAVVLTPLVALGVYVVIR